MRLFLLLGLLCLCGCAPEQPVSKWTHTWHDQEVQIMHYGGHDYLQVNSYKAGGITHHPDCKCKPWGMK